MKQPIFAVLFALILGVAAAFFRPAQPYQVPPLAADTALFVPRGGSGGIASSAFDDAGLDNAEIEADTNISPSRKCGFCMGWVSKHRVSLCCAGDSVRHL